MFGVLAGGGRAVGPAGQAGSSGVVILQTSRMLSHCFRRQQSSPREHLRLSVTVSASLRPKRISTVRPPVMPVAPLDTLLVVYPLQPPSLVDDLRKVFKVRAYELCRIVSRWERQASRVRSGLLPEVRGRKAPVGPAERLSTNWRISRHHSLV